MAPSQNGENVLTVSKIKALTQTQPQRDDDEERWLARVLVIKADAKRVTALSRARPGLASCTALKVLYLADNEQGSR